MAARDSKELNNGGEATIFGRQTGDGEGGDDVFARHASLSRVITMQPPTSCCGASRKLAPGQGGSAAPGAVGIEPERSIRR